MELHVTQDAIRQKALDLLTRRDHTDQEIMQKLMLRGYSKEAMQPIVQALVETGLIDNQRFAENYRHWRAQKGYGPLRIHQELQSRGVSPEIIAEVINMADNAWSVDARNLWIKHFKSCSPRDFKECAKQMRFLQYRGYTREQIEAAINQTVIPENY